MNSQTPGVDLEPQQWTIGSSPQSDVWVDRPAVSSRHCRLTRRGQQFLLEDLGSTNGVFIGGSRMMTPTHVTAMTPVTLGRETPLPWPATSGATRVIRFGRDAPCEVRLVGAGVSAVHGHVVLGPRGTIVVCDRASTNGIVVERPDGTRSHRIEKSAVVETSDTLWLGATPLRVASIVSPTVSPATRLPTLVASSVQRQRVAKPISSSPLIGWIIGGLVPVCLLVLGTLGFKLMSRDAASSSLPVLSTASATISTETTSSPPALQTSPVDRPVAAVDSTAPSWQSALFWITVHSDDELTSFRVGTAWMHDSSTLLTTGSVCQSMNDLLATGQYVRGVAIHLATGQSVSLGKTRFHPEFAGRLASVQAASAAYQASVQNDSTSAPAGSNAEEAIAARREELMKLGQAMLDAQAAYVASDAAAIEVASPLPPGIQRLELAIDTVARRGQKCSLASAPFDLEDPFYDSVLPVDFQKQDWRIVDSARPRSGLTKLLLESTSSGDAAPISRQNWFGSPILDSGTRVVAAFSMTSALLASDAPPKIEAVPESAWSPLLSR